MLFEPNNLLFAVLLYSNRLYAVWRVTKTSKFPSWHIHSSFGHKSPVFNHYFTNLNHLWLFACNSLLSLEAHSLQISSLCRKCYICALSHMSNICPIGNGVVETRDNVAYECMAASVLMKNSKLSWCEWFCKSCICD